MSVDRSRNRRPGAIFIYSDKLTDAKGPDCADCM